MICCRARPRPRPGPRPRPRAPPTPRPTPPPTRTHGGDHDLAGPDQGRARQRQVADHRGQLPEVRAGRLLRRHHLPPRDARLHDPGRRHDPGHEGEAHPARPSGTRPRTASATRGARSPWPARTTPTAPPRSSSSTSRTTTASTSASAAPATRSSARWWRGWTSWTRSWACATTAKGAHENVPATAVVIKSVREVGEGAAPEARRPQPRPAVSRQPATPPTDGRRQEALRRRMSLDRDEAVVLLTACHDQLEEAAAPGTDAPSSRHSTTRRAGIAGVHEIDRGPEGHAR